MQLNHANLPVPNVPALRDFFAQHFDFEVLPAPGGDKFAVLEGEGGFILNLMYDKESESPEAMVRYPKNFHIGFYLNTPAEVREKHAALTSAGITASEVEELNRGGFASVTFYCYGPGGLLVEVSAQGN